MSMELWQVGVRSEQAFGHGMPPKNFVGLCSEGMDWGGAEKMKRIHSKLLKPRNVATLNTRFLNPRARCDSSIGT